MIYCYLNTFFHFLNVIRTNKIEFVTDCTLVIVIATHVIMIIENSSVKMQRRNIIPLGIQQTVFEIVKIDNCVNKKVTLGFWPIKCFSFKIILLWKRIFEKYAIICRNATPYVANLNIL